MLKKIGLIVFVIVWLIFGVYLVLPAPSIADLPNSIKSTEPGDTVQVPGVSGYYDNFSREQVMAFYKSQFCCSVFDRVLLPTLDLNHPPEFAKQRIRDEIRAWYFEELVHPFRESLYVSGWTPALAQASLGIKYPPIVYDKNFPKEPRQVLFQKTTIRQMPTTLASRLLVYGLMTLVLILGFWISRRAIRGDVLV